MKKEILISIIFIMLLAPGCVETPSETPAPTATPAATATPTPVPTTYVPTPRPPEGAPVKYIVWMDSDYGFYRIRAVEGNRTLQLPPGFAILNFSIRTGDKVKWMNDDSYDFPLTLVSNEGLWTGRTGLTRYQGERFEYVFNRTGTYTFSIREYPRLADQKITVEQS